MNDENWNRPGVGDWDEPSKERSSWAAMFMVLSPLVGKGICQECFIKESEKLNQPLEGAGRGP